MLTTRSKLTVQAPGFGERGARQSAILGALAAVHILVHCRVSGVGRLNGSLLGRLRKDVALVSRCVPVLGRGTDTENTGKGTVLDCIPDTSRTAHFMCAVRDKDGREKGRFLIESLARWRTAHFMCTVRDKDGRERGRFLIASLARRGRHIPCAPS
ncbi:conserved hypothetical protein [Candidatus Desulfosporosinus infrequens]|uniref:Uncharacterized protein n=1 Tax=Candidatus Desulfosporosinus infrequens TaxID=2043169 RepID=A0A2U3LT07_9FIRM|nr:conserved hypothetical protein [Candidatus Desulfosporosinus infrequens]